MADRVRYVMDRMASTFSKIQDMGIFSPDEVRSIVKRRTDYEYVMMRRQLTEADYYKYLEYETNLNKLRDLRCQAAGYSETNKEIQAKVRDIRATFIRHISYIFERAVRRFPHSMELWNDYISFLKESQALKSLNAILGKAISLHPKVETFWLQAAMHELVDKSNASAARILLQR